jgi:hypothetical protein
LTQLSLARNADLLKTNKCRLILESLFTGAPVAAHYYAQRRGIVASSVHIQISIVHRNNKKMLAMLRVYNTR